MINGNIYASDWVLYKENSCVVPLLSNVWIVWVTMFGRMQRLEDITIWKREHRGQKEKKLPGLERTLERNGRWLRGEAEQHWTVRLDNSKTTRH